MTIKSWNTDKNTLLTKVTAKLLNHSWVNLKRWYNPASLSLERVWTQILSPPLLKKKPFPSNQFQKSKSKGSVTFLDPPITMWSTYAALRNLKPLRLVSQSASRTKCLCHLFRTSSQTKTELCMLKSISWSFSCSFRLLSSATLSLLRASSSLRERDKSETLYKAKWRILGWR